MDVDDEDKPMWIVIGTMLFNALIESVLVGLSWEGIKRRFGIKVSWIQNSVVLFVVFGLLSAYYVPAIIALDATLTIGNEEIAREIGPGTPVVLSELFRFGISDTFIWVAQVVVALLAGRLLSRGEVDN